MLCDLVRNMYLPLTARQRRPKLSISHYPRHRPILARWLTQRRLRPFRSSRRLSSVSSFAAPLLASLASRQHREMNPAQHGAPTSTPCPRYGENGTRFTKHPQRVFHTATADGCQLLSACSCVSSLFSML